MPSFEKYLSPNVITIFSKSYCPFCIEAKQAMSSLGLKTKAYEVDLNEVPNDVVKEIQKSTNHSTWPSIFVGHDSIKGFSDMQRLMKTGGFSKLVEKNHILKENH